MSKCKKNCENCGNVSLLQQEKDSKTFSLLGGIQTYQPKKRKGKSKKQIPFRVLVCGKFPRIESFSFTVPVKGDPISIIYGKGCIVLEQMFEDGQDTENLYDFLDFVAQTEPSSFFDCD